MLYQSDFELGHVALNVFDLEKQVLFYQQVLGMTVFSSSETEAILGVGTLELVRLIKTEDQTMPSKASGLYHLAILLPSREALSQIFRHFLINKIPLIGGADHGYSEALYLQDPEGNGLEIYRDLPQEAWDIHPDGKIIGKTESLDERGLFELTDFSGPYRMPEGTRMGHVHLQSPSSQKSSDQFQDVLGVADKFSIPTGAWLASGTYHHHLAVNEWEGPNLLKRREGMRGLAYYSIDFDRETDYKLCLLRAKRAGWDIQLEQQAAFITDQDGIKVRLNY
ncbi:catechol 2,3-dioxygenase [Streptococcus rupicaprae]|uniref:Catechol 2,3-dioxygenase n=1 Tax=Streptococcus rupicaprae TaxID=759619 RepID=A0ABV2FIV7_9STRE